MNLKSDAFEMVFMFLGMLIAGVVVFGAALFLHGLDEILTALVLP